MKQVRDVRIELRKWHEELEDIFIASPNRLMQWRSPVHVSLVQVFRDDCGAAHKSRERVEISFKGKHVRFASS